MNKETKAAEIAYWLEREVIDLKTEMKRLATLISDKEFIIAKLKEK